MNKQNFQKRSIDLIIALALLPLAILLCMPLIIAIRLESPGSPLFVQRRVGRYGHVFRVFKLRTMGQATGDLPSHEVDPMRITAMGAFLRRSKLDELPQLINVIGGSMSLVGPRPCLPSQDVLVSERHARGLLDIRPGVTGPAQIAGIDMADPRRLVQVEEAYYRDASTLKDIGILWRTVFGAGRGDAARVEHP